MEIHKLTFDPTRLRAAPAERLSAFLLVGHFLSEANWLQKLLLVASQDRSGGKPERDARLSLALMVTRIFLAKIHEGWNRIRNQPLHGTLSSLSPALTSSPRYAALQAQLAKDSIAHRIRNNVGFHYPHALSLEGLPGIARDDVGIYMTDHVGDTLSILSELSAATSLMPITGAATLQDAIGKTLDEAIAVGHVYVSFLHEALEALVDEFGEHEDQTFTDPAALRFDELQARFFAIMPVVDGAT